MTPATTSRVPGVNDRVWNALEKLAVADPEAFVDYYANDVVALAATAWLGPGYQVTSQVNVVNPGGAGQTVHRDYHLGFQSPKTSAEFPAHVHALSPVLTLQGAVAHCDMPVETGPTLYLPHSQKYAHGYLAYWLPEFQEYFVAHHVQLPLAKGDAVFFNPALFHAAGIEPHDGRAPHGQPPAGVVGVRPRHGDASTGAASSRRSTRRCSPARPPGCRPPRRRRRRRLRRGVRLPDQPRPRPAGQRHVTRDAGRPRPPGSRRGDLRRGAQPSGSLRR